MKSKQKEGWNEAIGGFTRIDGEIIIVLWCSVPSRKDNSKIDG